MSMPAILGSFLSEGYDAYKVGAFTLTDHHAVLVGMVVAAVSGYLAIRFVLHVITRMSLNWFALYVVVLGFVVIYLQGVNLFYKRIGSKNHTDFRCLMMAVRRLPSSFSAMRMSFSCEKYASLGVGSAAVTLDHSAWEISSFFKIYASSSRIC